MDVGVQAGIGGRGWTVQQCDLDTCCCYVLLLAAGGPHLERRGQPAGEQGVQDATSGQLRLSCTVELAV